MNLEAPCYKGMKFTASAAIGKNMEGGRMSTTTKDDGTIVWTNDKLFSSKKQDWGTPWDFFAKVNEEFNFVS